MVRIHFPPAKSQANYGTAEATWARGQAVDLVDDHDVDRAGLGRRNLRGSLRFLSPFNCGETRRPTEGFCRNDPNITSAIAEPTAA
jgi:hypothetical protein